MHGSIQESKFIHSAVGDMAVGLRPCKIWEYKEVYEIS